jgi:tetratricopeptide (TPR) repeat protein
MSKRVFISSTSLDLKKYRQAAVETCKTLDFEPIVMEDFEAMPVGATEGSKRKLKEADLYVGIIAHRYGYIERGYDRSVTEIEFDYAGERGLDRLCFVVDPAYPWPKTAVERKNAAKLAAFKARIDETVIRATFTSVEDFQEKLVKALVEWQEWRSARSGELEAVLGTLPDDIPYQPEALIGRDELAAQLNALLDKNKRVLLQGFGGMGKTALAAAVAAGRLREGKGPVVWLRAGAEDLDGLLSALARAFNAQGALVKETGTAAQARIVRLLMAGQGVKLVVLDDVWNGRALSSLLSINAIPGGTPVIVTSRSRYPGLTRLDVGRLSRAAALALLCHASGDDCGSDPQAGALCAHLGDHAFAIRLAGMIMALDSLSPGDMLARISDPSQITAPDGVADEGRASVEDLLQASIYTLDAGARAVFLAFGAFFTASATPELLALYMDGREESALEDTLNRLQRRGLAERLSEGRSAEYQIHDLAYSYVKARATDAQRHQALDACLKYLERYKEPRPDHFNRLRAELDNFMGAVSWAMTAGRYADVMRFADWLYRGFDSDTTEGFLHLQGYAGMATTLLQQAAAAAYHLGDRRKQAAYLGNLGSACRDLGQVRQGMKYYRQALKIYRELDDPAGQGITLGRLGIGYRILGQTQQAVSHLEQALALAQQVGDRRNEGINLANLGIVCRQMGQMEKAIAYLEQALAITAALGDRRGEAINLGNLGDIYRETGQLEAAVNYFQQALAIARGSSDRRGEGINLGRIGDVYREQRRFSQAADHLEQALAIARETGDKRSEAINLGRLGDTARDQGQTAAALDYHTQSLHIARQMDDKRGEGYSLLDLGRDHHAAGQRAEALAHYQTARAIFDGLGAERLVARIDAWVAALRDGTS